MPRKIVQRRGRAGTRGPEQAEEGERPAGNGGSTAGTTCWVAAAGLARRWFCAWPCGSHPDHGCALRVGLVCARRTPFPAVAAVNWWYNNSPSSSEDDGATTASDKQSREEDKTPSQSPLAAALVAPNPHAGDAGDRDTSAGAGEGGGGTGQDRAGHSPANGARRGVNGSDSAHGVAHGGFGDRADGRGGEAGMFARPVPAEASRVDKVEKAGAVSGPTAAQIDSMRGTLAAPAAAASVPGGSPGPAAGGDRGSEVNSPTDAAINSPLEAASAEDRFAVRGRLQRPDSKGARRTNSQK
jgi:hypothetical protein